jgi:hypothetical protein
MFPSRYLKTASDNRVMAVFFSNGDIAGRVGYPFSLVGQAFQPA